MKRKLFVVLAGLVSALAVAAVLLFAVGAPWLAGLNPYYALADWSSEDTTDTQVTAKMDARGRHARLLSAFFGVDGGLPPVLRFLFCPFAPGRDGMPVIFSRELDVSSVQAADFQVVSRSGNVTSPVCTTFMPAADAGELRTVLLAGEFGSAADQPVSVEITGNILSMDGSVNFRGAGISVVPLEAGPQIALAEAVPQAQWRQGARATRLPWGGGTGCPDGTRQAVRVTWQGGVTKPGGSDADDNERGRYEVDFLHGDSTRSRTPSALADLGDGDNNHLLCFDDDKNTAGRPVEVRFPAGFLTDPREDLNPATSAPVGQ